MLRVLMDLNFTFQMLMDLHQQSCKEAAAMSVLEIRLKSFPVKFRLETSVRKPFHLSPPVAALLLRSHARVFCFFAVPY